VSGQDGPFLPGNQMGEVVAREMSTALRPLFL
jgi:hypothetical protein